MLIQQIPLPSAERRRQRLPVPGRRRCRLGIGFGGCLPFLSARRLLGRKSGGGGGEIENFGGFLRLNRFGHLALYRNHQVVQLIFIGGARRFGDGCVAHDPTELHEVPASGYGRLFVAVGVGVAGHVNRAVRHSRGHKVDEILLGINGFRGHNFVILKLLVIPTAGGGSGGN